MCSVQLFRSVGFYGHGEVLQGFGQVLELLHIVTIYSVKMALFTLEIMKLLIFVF